LSLRCAQKHSGLHLGQVEGRTKDLACLGKGLANNVEVACWTGEPRFP